MEGVDWRWGLVYQLRKVTAASRSPSKDMQKAVLEMIFCIKPVRAAKEAGRS
jgi:hypothetical protein